MRNPAKKIARVPEPEEPLRPIPTADLRQLLAAAEPPLRHQLTVQALTGARWIETARLGPNDLFLDQSPPYCLLRTRKMRGGGERIRKQYLPPGAVEALRAQMEGYASTTHVFSGRHDGQQTHDAAVKQLHRACERADIPHYGFHRIRYWTGSQALTMDVSNKTIARFLGHVGTQATERYMRLEDPLLVDLAGHLEQQLGAARDRRGNPVSPAP